MKKERIIPQDHILNNLHLNIFFLCLRETCPLRHFIIFAFVIFSSLGRGEKKECSWFCLTVVVTVTEISQIWMGKKKKEERKN